MYFLQWHIIIFMKHEACSITIIKADVTRVKIGSIEDLEVRRAELLRFRKRMMWTELFLFVYIGCIGAFLYRAVKKASKGGAEGVNAWGWALSALVFYVSIP